MSRSPDSVKVAVRVRPFTQREKDGGTKNIISMSDGTTTIEDLTNNGATRKFIFDKSYWSHDGYEEDATGYLRPKPGSNYADQRTIFKELGEELVENAWNGYNCSIFAYGQTGSGKSYSIMGFKQNKGIVPLLCEKLFGDIKSKKQQDVIYQVKFSMIEIYNEEVRDLLNRKKTPQKELKVRETNKDFYVENVTEVPTESVEEVNMKIEDGNRERTIASTKMNDMSSRAHTITTLEFNQNFVEKKVVKQSKICMVDLAGSERAKQADTSGERLKEGISINTSLLTLGNVIKSLCDIANGKGISVHTPYRDSVLTKLLKNALGGNSKTVMIATISPSSENYDQTMSTLRYADRAKSIRNQARVNEEKTDELIKKLLEEKQQLLKELNDTKSNVAHGFTEEEMIRLKEKIAMLEKEKDNMKAIWKQESEQNQKEKQKRQLEEMKMKDEKNKFPQLIKLNEDPSLAGYIIHIIKKDTVTIGNSRATPKPDIIVYGPSVVMKNGSLKSSGGEIYLSSMDGKVFYNGIEMKQDQKIKLNHFDRVLFGTNYNHGLFLFVHPQQAEKLKKQKKRIAEPTYETAAQEIAANTEVQLDISEVKDKYLREQIVKMEGNVRQANSMADYMDRNISFEVVLLSGMFLGHGRDSKLTSIFVKAVNMTNGCEYLWSKNEFLDQYAMMEVMYDKYVEKDGEWEKNDPFFIPHDTPTRIGVAFVTLMSVAHMIEHKGEKYEVYNYKGDAVGHLTVSFIPCDTAGKESNSLTVQQPCDLVGLSISFKIQIPNAISLPDRFKSSWCTFQLLQENESRFTQEASGRSPSYSYNELIVIKNVSLNDTKYFENSDLTIEIWGRQVESISQNPLARRAKRNMDEREISRMIMELEKTKKQLGDIRSLVLASERNKLTEKILSVLER